MPLYEYGCSACGRTSEISHRMSDPPAVDCPLCGRAVTNPLAHVCKVRTDFRKRLAERKRQQAKAAREKARAQRPQHDYHACRDPDCRRRTCTAYKEGYADGHRDGFEIGYAEGYAAGAAEARGR